MKSRPKVGICTRQNESHMVDLLAAVWSIRMRIEGVVETDISPSVYIMPWSTFRACL